MLFETNLRCITTWHWKLRCPENASFWVPWSLIMAYLFWIIDRKLYVDNNMQFLEEVIIMDSFAFIYACRLNSLQHKALQWWQNIHSDAHIFRWIFCHCSHSHAIMLHPCTGIEPNTKSNQFTCMVKRGKHTYKCCEIPLTINLFV